MAEYVEKQPLIEMFNNLASKYINGDKRQRGLAYANAADMVALTEAADVQPVDRWINTKDRLPDVGQPVLIYYPCWGGTEVQAARLEYDKLFFEICGEFNASVNKVTHWQPLPVPPKD